MMNKDTIIQSPHNKKETAITWVKEHKKQLIAAGISTSLIITSILCMKNMEKIDKWTKSIKDILRRRSENGVDFGNTPNEFALPDITVDDILDPEPVHRITCKKRPHHRNGHIRNLGNRHPSAEKIATALENGFSLSENQTWVKGYDTRSAA